LVRAYVAQRLPEGRLFRLIRDPDRQVRKLVARRLPDVSLGLMAFDEDGNEFDFDDLRGKYTVINFGCLT
jgi:hypothetical protein